MGRRRGRHSPPPLSEKRALEDLEVWVRDDPGLLKVAARLLLESVQAWASPDDYMGKEPRRRGREPKAYVAYLYYLAQELHESTREAVLAEMERRRRDLHSPTSRGSTWFRPKRSWAQIFRVLEAVLRGCVARCLESKPEFRKKLPRVPAPGSVVRALERWNRGWPEQPSGRKRSPRARRRSASPWPSRQMGKKLDQLALQDLFHAASTEPPRLPRK